MAYKYQYNPAATDNVSLHDTGRGRTAGSLTYRSSARMRQTEEELQASLGTKCCYGLLYLSAQVFLHAPIALILLWICTFRAQRTEEGGLRPFAWRGETEVELELTWNLHPFLMLTGFVYFMGQGMLVYRTCTCCRRIYGKLLHSSLHLLAVPCIVLAFLAVWDYKSRRTSSDGQPDPVLHFYSIHSWLGLAAMATFSLQLILGLFSFLLLLACEAGTAGFRARLVPVHSIFGTGTFVLAVASAVCGLTEKALIDINVGYFRWVDVVQSLTPPEQFTSNEQQSILLNVTAASLGLLAVLLPLLLWYPKFRFRSANA